MNARLFGNGADSGLLGISELGARGEDTAVVGQRGVSPKLLNRPLHAINGDGNIGVRARLVVGKLNGGSGFPRGFGGGGKADGGEEDTGEGGSVGELHLEDLWLVMIDC